MKLWTRFLVVAGTLIYSFVLYADSIQVHNKSEDSLFAAVYYVNKTVTRATLVYAIRPGATVSVERPIRKIGSDRQLVFSSVWSELADTLTLDGYNALYSVNIGAFQGKAFTIGTTDMKIAVNKDSVSSVSKVKRLFNSLKETSQASVLQTKDTLSGVALLARNSLNEAIKSWLDSFINKQYAQMVAYVRVSNTVCQQEKEYLKERRKHTKEAIEKLLQRKISSQYVPTIAIVASGGGYRAMLTTAGNLSGAGKNGILDATTYAVGLSGSTWCIGTWLALGLPINEFVQDLIELLNNNKNLAHITPAQAQSISNVILTRYAFDQPLSLVDFYGGLLANALLVHFKDKRQQVYLSDQAQHLKGGHFPLPIHTAISAELGQQYYWYEFTPYEVGSSWLGMYIPTWSYGRRFMNGISTDMSPELTLGFNFGTYGSAFAISFERLYQEVARKEYDSTKQNIVQDLLYAVLAKGRISAAKVANFTYGMATSKRKDDVTLALSDAGIDFNLPYPPVSGERSGRKADILIFLDASANIAGGSQLKAVEQYARRNHVNFPRIDYTGIDKKAVSLFIDTQDPQAPVVIYMPRVKDQNAINAYKATAAPDDVYVKTFEHFDPDVCAKKEFCGTLNFSYSTAESTAVVRAAEFNMLQAAESVKRALEWVLQNKTGK